MNGKSPASRRKYQCTKCNSWADEGDLLNAVASAVMDKLTPAHLDKLRQVIARKVKQPPQPKKDVKSLEQQLEKQKRNRLALDVPDPEQFRDAVRAIEAEICRLEREIALAKRETQQRRQSDPDRLVEQAMGRLKVLPAVLKNGDDQQVKAFLQTSVDHVDVWTEKTGSGNKTRYSLARGEIHFVSPTEQDLSR